MLRLARRPCRVAGFVLRRNTPPGELVGADLHGREAGWSFPSSDDTSVRSRLIQCRARRLPPGRFELSDGSCCNYTSLNDLSIVLLAETQESMMQRCTCNQRHAQAHASIALGSGANIVGSASHCAARDGLPQIVIVTTSLPTARDSFG